MRKKMNKKVSVGLRDLAHKLAEEAGYPDKTTEDPTEAFCYGLMMGAALFLAREFEMEESEGE